MKTRILTLLIVAAAALTAVSIAHANTSDTLHQHGWANIPSLATQKLNCWSGYGLVSNSVSTPPPNLITTPGGTQKVAMRAQLEYYDFSRNAWMDQSWDGSKWVKLPSSVWYYVWAKSTGIYVSWRELDTDRWASSNVSFNVNPGFYFRIHFYYYWYYDGAKREDVTNYCLSA